MSLKIKFNKNTLEPLKIEKFPSCTKVKDEELSKVMDVKRHAYNLLDAPVIKTNYFLDYRSYKITREHFRLTMNNLFKHMTCIWYNDLLIGISVDIQSKEFLKEFRSVYHFITYYKDKPYELINYVSPKANYIWNLYQDKSNISFNRYWTNNHISNSFDVFSSYFIEGSLVCQEIRAYVYALENHIRGMYFDKDQKYNEDYDPINEILTIRRLDNIMHISTLMGLNCLRRVTTRYPSNSGIHGTYRGGYSVELKTSAIADKLIKIHLLKDKQYKGLKAVVSDQEVEEYKKKFPIDKITIPMLSDFVNDENYYHLYMLHRQLLSELKYTSNIYLRHELDNLGASYFFCSWIKYLIKLSYIPEEYIPEPILQTINKYHKDHMEYIKKFYDTYKYDYIYSSSNYNQYLVK